MQIDHSYKLTFGDSWPWIVFQSRCDNDNIFLIQNIFDNFLGTSAVFYSDSVSMPCIPLLVDRTNYFNQTLQCTLLVISSWTYSVLLVLHHEVYICEHISEYEFPQYSHISKTKFLDVAVFSSFFNCVTISAKIYF